LLYEKINAAGVIWNHIVRLLERHRSLFYPKKVKEIPEKWKMTLQKIKGNKQNKKYPGKPFSSYRVYDRLQHRRQKNSSRLGKTLNELYTRNIQNLTERLERAYRLFFTKLKKGERDIEPAKTKSPFLYPSITFKQCGFKFFWPQHIVTFFGQEFKFHADYIPSGKIKTVTVKRDGIGDIYLYVVSDESIAAEISVQDTRPLVGMDVWLNPILTLSDGSLYETPMFYKEKMKELATLDKQMAHKREAKKKREKKEDKKLPASAKYKKLRTKRFRLFKTIASKRREHHIELAKELASKYGVIGVPDVPIKRLSKHFGLKVGDLAYSAFLSWLSQQCQKTGTKLFKISGREEMILKCHLCGHTLEKMPKKTWTCPNCGAEHGRELNLAKNIENATINALAKGENKNTEEILSITVDRRRQRKISSRASVA
jgi:putative transposase